MVPTANYTNVDFGNVTCIEQGRQLQNLTCERRPGRMIQVQPKHPRARRLPFVAPIELTDVSSEIQMIERTNDLSFFGCHINTLKPLPAETKVWIRIEHEGANFVAWGKVIFSSPHSGMGVVFTKVEPNSQVILEKWIDQLRVRK